MDLATCASVLVSDGVMAYCQMKGEGGWEFVSDKDFTTPPGKGGDGKEGRDERRWRSPCIVATAAASCSNAN